MPYKKPRAKAVREAGAKAPQKKKKRKKINKKDRMHAVAVAALLVLTAVVISMAVVFLRANRSSSLAAGQAPNTAVESFPAEEAPVEKIAPDIKSEPAPIEPPGTQQSAVKSTPAPAPQPAAQPAPQPAIKSTSAPAPQPARALPQAEKTTPVTETRTVESRNLPVVSQTSGAVPERSSVTAKGTLVFLIDDAGHNLRDLEPFLKFPGPMTIAVLPGLSYSAEAARRIRAAGKEVFLHQPMESIAGHDPGPGAIMAGMSRDEIRAIITRNLNEVGPVAGINNHEGSRVTMDEQAMEIILALCRERGIMFCDSRTTAETAVPRAAQKMGMFIGERDVFLDNVQERESMIGYINTALQRAEQKGSAIMIGHVWSPLLAPLLSEMFPDLSRRGYAFSSVSKLINGKGL